MTVFKICRLLQLGFFVWAYIAGNQNAMIFTGILYIASVIDSKEVQA